MITIHCLTRRYTAGAPDDFPAVYLSLSPNTLRDKAALLITNDYVDPQNLLFGSFEAPHPPESIREAGACLKIAASDNADFERAARLALVINGWKPDVAWNPRAFRLPSNVEYPRQVHTLFTPADTSKSRLRASGWLVAPAGGLRILIPENQGLLRAEVDEHGEVELNTSWHHDERVCEDFEEEEEGPGVWVDGGTFYKLIEA